MKNLFSIVFLLLTGIMLIASCREPYTPQTIEASNNYLVIEGILNNGGPTSIRLSRTRPLNDPIEKPETKAIVSIENESNQSFLLTENGKGVYTTQLSLNKLQKYRLRVKTASAREYLSAFVPVLNAPPVDAVTWKKMDGGVQIYVDTHDPDDKTHYYRWEYEETWEDYVPHESLIDYVNGNVITRINNPFHKICYPTGNADGIFIASTTKLVHDVVSQAPLNFISPGSEKLAYKYSILVKQHVLEQKAHEYWLHMQKNTEKLGSIFDPQPSYIYGNIQCINNPEEMVIGYFSAGNITEKRIFITRQEADWFYRETCPLDTIKTKQDLPHYLGNGSNQLGMIPIKALNDNNNLPPWVVGPRACVDCGINYIKPTYW